MDITLFIWLLIAIFLWVLLITVQAIDIRPTDLSPFELRRRVKDGDTEAILVEQREELRPRIVTLRRLLVVLCMVMASVVTVVLLGWIVGTIVAVAIGFFIGSITRHTSVRRMSQQLYDRNEIRLLRLVSRWTWLDALRGYAPPQAPVEVDSREELLDIIDRSSRTFSRDERLRLRAGLNFGRRTVGDIMTPVSVVDMASVNDSLGPLVLDGLHKTGHSRFPVIDGDIHHVVGILYLRELIDLKTAKTTVKDAMSPNVHYINEHHDLEHALHGFLRTRRHLFIVVNEFRETVGILTLEDAIEALIGKKIIDEFDHFDDLRVVAASNPRKNNTPRKRTDV